VWIAASVVRAKNPYLQLAFVVPFLLHFLGKQKCPSTFMSCQNQIKKSNELKWKKN
jgi:hypothetical protein